MPLYDVWAMPEGKWFGMTMGATPQAARASLPDDREPSTVLLTPYHGVGSSNATFIALVGRAPCRAVNSTAQQAAAFHLTLNLKQPVHAESQPQ
jgi:hypothetical protein